MGILFVIISAIVTVFLCFTIFLVVDYRRNYQKLYECYDGTVIDEECLDAIIRELFWTDPTFAAYTAYSKRVYRMRLKVQIVSAISLDVEGLMLHCNSVLHKGRPHFISWLTFQSPYSRLSWVAWVAGDKYHLSLLPGFAFLLSETTRHASPEACMAYIEEYQTQA